MRLLGFVTDVWCLFLLVGLLDKGYT